MEILFADLLGFFLEDAASYRIFDCFILLATVLDYTTSFARSFTYILFAVGTLPKGCRIHSTNCYTDFIRYAHAADIIRYPHRYIDWIGCYKGLNIGASVG